ncbi:hypothetical protein [Achromobacter sp. 2789STDY5608633]|jgi:hypothetical protein|uniref:hypothetical protein n=1 Tax=Achromobacter sp. 2789STDY5608633 TaxID=1806501 RepID=UPI0012E31185|nr:hypothetical protein [Achromobacter sp. 2789STDY5608633]
MPKHTTVESASNLQGETLTVEGLLRAHQDALAYLRTLAHFGGNLQQARALAEKGFNAIAAVGAGAHEGVGDAGIAEALRALAMTSHEAANLPADDRGVALHDLAKQLLRLAHGAPLSSPISVIQAAVNSVERPDKLTDKQWEWVKAGARLVVGRVNEICSKEGVVR